MNAKIRRLALSGQPCGSVLGRVRPRARLLFHFPFSIFHSQTTP
jgi:hypothetical protein